MSCPMLVSNFCTPKVIWYQTDVTVVIRVLLIDVSDYYLRVENDCLFFSTITGGKKYYLILNLFGAVIAEKTVHKNVGREIKIYLTKGFKWKPWLRLIQCKGKDAFITYDVEYIKETVHIRRNYYDNDVARTNRQFDRKYIRPPRDEESESDDEIDFLQLS